LQKIQRIVKFANLYFIEVIPTVVVFTQ